MHCDSLYAGIIRDALSCGERLTTRNAPVYRLIRQQATFDRTPLVCARRCAWLTALREMEWFLSGSNNINDAHPSVRPWWEPWADKHGVVWANYGQQLRHYGWDFDQVTHLIDGIKHHPFSRRNILTTWHASDMADPATPITNCHQTITQAFVGNHGDLGLLTYQRSADVVCGLPHNWIQAWALLLWLAQRTGTHPQWLTWVGGDVHVYVEHEALARRIVEDQPDLVYTPTSEEFRAADFALSGPYTPLIQESARMIV